MALLAQVSTQKLITSVIQSGFDVQFINASNQPGSVLTGALSFATSSSFESYTLANNSAFTGSVSSLGLIRYDGNLLESGSLYLSSLYLGGVGGSVYGQLTTDSSGSDVYWNGTSLTSGGGGGITTAQLTSTTVGLGTSGYLSSGGLGLFSTVYINLTPETAPFWNSNTFPGLGFDPEPNPLVLDIFGSARILKNLYIGSTTTIIGTGGIVGPTMTTTTLSAATSVVSSLGFITPESGIPMYLMMSNGTLEFNGQTLGTSVSLGSTIDGLGSSGYISSLTLNASLISTTSFVSRSFSSFSTALGPGGGLTTANLTSTVAGLGTLGYLSSIPSVLSTSQFFTSSATISTGLFNTVSTLVFNASTVTTTQITTSTITTNAMTMGVSPSWILTSPLQTLAVSTNTLWADQAYINTGVITTGTISTVTTNALTLGTGGTWILTSPIQTSVVSSVIMFASQPFFDTVNIGSVSTMNSMEYYGLFGNYNNTVLAEVSTGGGTQELLVFKGSSTSDRVRVQTTGNFVVETGVSARLFNSNTTQTLSNATPAFIVTTASNVGIQTATPGATLDVAGSGRFQSLSSLAIFASSIVAPYVFAAQYFTF